MLHTVKFPIELPFQYNCPQLYSEMIEAILSCKAVLYHCRCPAVLLETLKYMYCYTYDLDCGQDRLEGQGYTLKTKKFVRVGHSYLHLVTGGN